MTALFLSIPLLSGMGLIGAGDRLCRESRTTLGLAVALAGLGLLYVCYGYAVHWDIVRPL